jgi:hypothetical protein
LLPSWLGLAPWRPIKENQENRTVQVVSTEGLQKPEGEWVDIDKVWQFDDVRVKGTATLSSIELQGPKGQIAWSKKQYIQIHVKVANVGVARPIQFQGWDTAGVQFTDSTGKPVPPARFENGWFPTEFHKPATLTPGKLADWVLLFEAPTPPIEYLRLELPGAAYGVPEAPVRFQIPARPLGLKPNAESKP